MIVGLDTNILCYALDPDYPEHKCLADFFEKLSLERMVALNPTVLHEAYHVLVYYLEWEPKEAAQRLTLLLKHPYITFFNQTKQTTQAAFKLAVKHSLGGRDSLIMANYLINRIPVLYTHDQALLGLKSVTQKDALMTFEDPLKSP